MFSIEHPSYGYHGEERSARGYALDRLVGSGLTAFGRARRSPQQLVRTGQLATSQNPCAPLTGAAGVVHCAILPKSENNHKYMMI